MLSLHFRFVRDVRASGRAHDLSEGDVVKVKVLEVDKQGRVKLTMKGIEQDI